MPFFKFKYQEQCNQNLLIKLAKWRCYSVYLKLEKIKNTKIAKNKILVLNLEYQGQYNSNLFI